METAAVVWIVILSCLSTSWALEPISLTAAGLAASAASAAWGVFDRTQCRYFECCDGRSVPTDARNITALENVLRSSVYGQHLVQDVVIRALRGHLSNPDPPKALVLSFHGTPGSGKSYVSNFIAQSLYFYGVKSKFVKVYVGGTDFPEDSKSDIYRLKVTDDIRRIVQSCERALFIFEDVARIPSNLIDSINAFIDHHVEVQGLDFRKSIFILITNAGTSAINQKTLELWTEGKQREDIIKLKDFEALLREGAFNEEGGLFKSAAIRYHLIDHYIPFLPLEEKHVRMCIDDAFKKFGYHIAPAGAVEKILEDLTFMPPEMELYSTTGCKRVGSKVAAYVYGERFTKF